LAAGVSVVIPTRNRASYLPLAIESVLNQTPPPLEVIVVDDGSTDGTAAIVGRYGDQIIYRKIRNGGRPAVPRNVGIELARGELVAFQDSDDEWAPGKLERGRSRFCLERLEPTNTVFAKPGSAHYLWAMCGPESTAWRSIAPIREMESSVN